MTVKADIKQYRRSVISLSDTYPDLSHRFFDREQARHNLEDLNHQTRQDHFDLTLEGGTRGCWQIYLHDRGADRLEARTFEDKYLAQGAASFYVTQGYEASRHASNFFGESISVSLENQIRDLLLEGIDTAFVENDPRFVAFLDTIDDTALSVNNGSIYVEIGDETRRRHRSSDGSLMYESEDIVRIYNYIDSDSTSSIQLIIPTGFKAEIKMVGDTEEVVTTSAKGTYQFTNIQWSEFNTKLINEMSMNELYMEITTSREE